MTAAAAATATATPSRRRCCGRRCRPATPSRHAHNRIRDAREPAAFAAEPAVPAAFQHDVLEVKRGGRTAVCIEQRRETVDRAVAYRPQPRCHGVHARLVVQQCISGVNGAVKDGR